MSNRKSYSILLIVACLLFPATLLAQIGSRYASPVFGDVTTTTEIPFSSVVGEDQILPTTLYLDFYEPFGDTLSARPLVITVFGGAFVAGNRDWSDMVEYCTRFAKHGYAAASIDYRLLPILSISSGSLIRDAYMASQDVSSAIRYFKAYCQEYRIDTNNIFLLGNSAGSIATLNEIFMSDEERPDVTFDFPDLGPINSSGELEYAGFSSKVAGAVAQWGGVLDVNVIDVDEYVPLCMIHGTADNVVPFDSGYCYSSLPLPIFPYMYGSYAIANHLSDLGIEDYEFHPFEGEKHNFYSAENGNLIMEKFDQCFNIARDFLYNHLDTHLTTGVSHYETDNVKIYPNPASDVLFVEVKEGGRVASITLCDMQGRIVKECDASPVSLGHLPSGVYVVHVKDSDGIEFIQKVVVK